MTDGGGYTLGAGVVECHHATVAEGELYLALTLLTGYLACHGAVHLVGEPVLRGHSLERESVGYIFFYIVFVVGSVLVGVYHSVVNQSGLGRRTKHVAHGQVDGFHTILLLKHKAMVACGLAHHIHRCAFAVGDGLDIFDVLLLQHHTHTLLALVADDFL